MLLLGTEDSYEKLQLYQNTIFYKNNLIRTQARNFTKYF